MSLLNEALRKNRMEKTEKSVPDFSERYNKRSVKNVILIIAVFTAAAAVFLIVWMKISNRNPGQIVVESDINNSEKITDRINEPETVTPAPPEANHVPVVEEISHSKVINAGEIEALIHEKPVEINKNKNVEPLNAELVRELHENIEDKAVREEGIISKEKHDPVPEEPEVEITNDEESFYRKAVQFHRQGRLESAISMYKKVLGFNQANTDAMFNLASIYITTKQYSDACTVLKELTDINPSDPEIILNLAVAEIGLGKNSDAVSHLEGIEEGDIDLQFRVLFHLGIALSRSGRHEEALNCYMDAEKLDRDNPLLILNMAVLYDKTGRYKNAVEYYLKLINSDLTSSPEKEKYRQRVEALQKNISLLPAGTSP